MADNLYILAFTGYKGAGKSTAADMAMRYAERSDLMVVRTSLAEPIKRGIAAFAQIDWEDDLKYKDVPHPKLGVPLRVLYRNVGMEFFRSTRTSIYADLLIERVLEAADGQPVLAIVDDVRMPWDHAAFENAAARYLLVRVVRPGFDSDGHVTEAHIAELPAHKELVNDSGLKALEGRVKKLVKEFLNQEEKENEQLHAGPAEDGDGS